MRPAVVLPGRSRQLERLLRHIEDPAARLIALTGPAGVGKSRVLEALEESLSPGILVLSHVCQSRDGGSGGALGGLLERLGRQLTPSGLLALYEEPGLRRLFALSPALLGHLEARQEPGQFQFMPVLESLVTLLGRLSQDRPLLLILDDLQFVDETSRSLLEGLLAHPALDELGVTLLIACRELDALPFAAEWSRLLGEVPGLLRVEVDPLDPEGLRELVASELDPEAPRNLEALLERLLAESGGLPFLAVLLLRHARRSGLVRATLEGWRCGAPDELSRLLRGGLVDELLAPLLEGQPAARLLLTWLRAVGLPVSLEPLRRAAPGRAEIWEPLAEELQRQGVLRHLPEEVGTGRWEFTHALWNELAGEWLEPAERRDFLLRVAAVLDESDLDQRVLRVGLLGRVARESANLPAREEAVDQLRGLLASLAEADANLELQLHLASELRGLAVSQGDYSLAVRTGVLASLAINAVAALAEWLEQADFERLDTAARQLVLQHMPRHSLILNRPAGLLPWVERMEARGDLCDTESAALLLTRLQRRYSNSDWEDAAPEFQRLAGLELLPEQVAWADVLRCLAAPAGGLDARARFQVLENLLREKSDLLSAAQQLSIFFEMHNLAHLFAGQPLLKPWHDPMVEQARRMASVSVARQRDNLARVLALVGRHDEAERMLRENLASFLRRRFWTPAAEDALFLLNLLKRQRRLDESARLVEELGTLLEQPATTYTQRAVVLTALGIEWRLLRTEVAARLLERAESFMEDERAPELNLALGYSRAHVRVQQAETGGDWAVAAAACEAMVEQYRGLGRGDVEMLIFCLMRDRALAHLHGPDPARRAADYLPAVASARERREYDLVRFQVLIGELALVTGEDAVVETVAEWLVDVEQDAAQAAAFRVAVACRRGDAPAASAALLETCCQLSTQPGSRLVQHLLGRWPGLTAWPPPRPCPPRLACLWAWALANLAQDGRPFRLPGLEVAESERSAFVRRTLAELREPSRNDSPAECERLERELERLENWLSEQEERAPGRGLRLQVLGPVRLLLDGRELDPATLKTRVGVELLALLAIRAWQGRERLSRDEILDALTLEGRPLLSESSLRVVISRLRKALLHESPEAIRFQERQGYAMAEDLGLSVDALDFELAWTRAQDAQRKGRAPEVERHLDDCLGLYRGSFLPGGAAWTEPLRGHFERRFMDAARQRLKLLEGQDELRGEFLARLKARLPVLAEFLAVEA